MSAPSSIPTASRPARQDWRVVDEGWGRAAAAFATLSEPANCREYVALHHALDVRAGDRILDVACGAGLALELAALRGATGAGIDASPRLIIDDRTMGMPKHNDIYMILKCILF